MTNRFKNLYPKSSAVDKEITEYLYNSLGKPVNVVIQNLPIDKHSTRQQLFARHVSLSQPGRIKALQFHYFEALYGTLKLKNKTDASEIEWLIENQ